MTLNAVVAMLSSPTQGGQLYGSSRVESSPPDLLSVYHLCIICIVYVYHLSVCSEVGNEVVFPWAVPMIL